jgi:spore coat polysaccharide biosynthesis protein SpsF (cytidylyltransferase family)
VKTAIVVQARIHSTRLPRKILLDLCGKTVLERVVDRCKQVQGADEVVVACPMADEIQIYERTGIPPFPGPEHDLVERLLGAARLSKADKLIRVTADCPMIDPAVIQKVLNHAWVVKHPVTVNWMDRKYPNGQDVEVYDCAWLEKWADGLSIKDREWFALKLVRHEPEHVHSVVAPWNASAYRMTLDYAHDLSALRMIQGAMGDAMWGWERIVSWMRENPKVIALTSKYVEKIGEDPKC